MEEEDVTKEGNQTWKHEKKSANIAGFEDRGVTSQEDI